MDKKFEQPDTSQNGSWRIWGILLVVLGGLGLALQALPIQTDVIGIVIPLGFALTFAAVYLTDRKHWWALIPAWVFLMGGATVLMSQVWPGAEIAIPVMLMHAVPFVTVYIVDRQHWWALIPAYIFLSVAFIVFAEAVLSWDIAALAPLIVALPFLAVYAVSPRDNWWALIPGGILGAVSIAFFLQNITIPLGALLIIAGGLYLMFGKRETEPPTATPEPQTGPAADKPRG